MNIIWDYIQTYLQRRNSRRTWKKILKEYPPEEAAEYFIGGGPQPWPHQRKRQMKEMQEAIRKMRADKPIEIKVKNVDRLIENGSTLEEALHIHSLTLNEYEMKKKEDAL